MGNEETAVLRARRVERVDLGEQSGVVLVLVVVVRDLAVDLGLPGSLLFLQPDERVLRLSLVARRDLLIAG